MKKQTLSENIVDTTVEDQSKYDYYQKLLQDYEQLE
jgi:hypothetical protein